MTMILIQIIYRNNYKNQRPEFTSEDVEGVSFLQRRKWGHKNLLFYFINRKTMSDLPHSRHYVPLRQTFSDNFPHFLWSILKVL